MGVVDQLRGRALHALPASTETMALVKKCFDHGLIILDWGGHGNIIRFLMPLVITDEQLRRGLAIVKAGLASINW